MRSRLLALIPVLALGAFACPDFHTTDPCARFAGRDAPASCLDGGTGAGGGGGGGGGNDSGTVDSGRPLSCEPIVLQSGDAGDLLQSCTFTDGGQGSCESDEQCVQLGTLFVCVRYCGADPTRCGPGTTCRSSDSTQGTLPGICVPTCDAHLAGGQCPSTSFSCAPSSPNLDDPGFCTPNCQIYQCPGGTSCNTTSGLCECVNDNGCGTDPSDQSFLKCSPTHRCYRPCSSGCGDGCCDSRLAFPFCRAATGTKVTCSPCTKDSECATGYCSPSDHKCNISSSLCSNTGDCERLQTTCASYFCACPQ